MSRHETDQPRNLDAERAVLGACLVSERALGTVLGELEREDFWSEKHRFAFDAITLAARESRGAVDHLTVAAHLPDGALGEDVRAFLFSLVEAVPTAAGAYRYALMVRDAARARGVLDAAARMRQSVHDALQAGEGFAGVPERAVAALEDSLRHGPRGTDQRVAPISEALDEFEAWVEAASSSGGVSGIRTGVGRLDRALGGLVDGRYYLVGGRPATGKSLLVGQIACNAARAGKRVLLQSAEMSAAQYLQRLAVATSGLDAGDAAQGRLNGDEEDRLFRAALDVAKLPIFVDDAGSQTPSRVRRNVLRHEPDLLVVDYLQRLVPEAHMRRAAGHEQMQHVSFEIDRLKKDFSIPVVAAVQLNRALEARADKRPVLSDLRSSGTLEQDADAVAFLHRPGFYSADEPDDVLEVRVEKNRFGPIAHTALRQTASLWLEESEAWARGVA